MAIAAFILSAVAVFIALASANYTRRQAITAEDTRAIEADRRHTELAPRLQAEYIPADRMRNGERPGVRLTNRGSLDLERIVVEMVPAPRTGEAALEGIYDPLTDGPTAVQETGRLRPGDAWTALEVIPAMEDMSPGQRVRGGPASFRCTCYASGHQPWTVVVDVEFPGQPRVFATWA